MESTNRPGKGSIEYYADGVSIRSPRKVTQGNKNPPKRGKVKEWSSASRRRMRVFMLTHEPAEDSLTVGATFTIPGPPLDVLEVRKLWQKWSRSAERLGWSAIWRMEVQKRGSVHWHAMVCVPRSFLEKPFFRPDGSVIPSLRLQLLMGRPAATRGVKHGTEDFFIASAVGKLWHETLNWFGPREFDPPYLSGKKQIEIPYVRSLLNLPGAHRRSAFCEVDTGERGAWKRYLQDHASKSKQEQIAEGFGRHWGVIGRKGFRQLLPNSVDTLTDAQFWRFIRAAQRMATPQLRSPSALFGRRLGRRSKRGAWGRSIWYSRPETIARLVAWASLTDEQPRREAQLHEGTPQLSRGTAPEGTRTNPDPIALLDSVSRPV